MPDKPHQPSKAVGHQRADRNGKGWSTMTDDWLRLRLAPIFFITKDTNVANSLATHEGSTWT